MGENPFKNPTFNHFSFFNVILVITPTSFNTLQNRFLMYNIVESGKAGVHKKHGGAQDNYKEIYITIYWR